jgi:DNA-binding transcriptional LysR family regulator
VLRIGTVNAATVQLLMGTLAEFRELHPETHVVVVGAQEAAIDSGLREGSFDLGLITALAGDDMPPEFETTRLARGQAVVCMRTDDPLAALEAVSVHELSLQPLIIMRSGYLMHRYVHRLLDGRSHLMACSTDGAEMGKLMVAEGLGVTVLPDFSVIGDPLERSGIITCRPLADDFSQVELGLRRRRSITQPRAVRDLHQLFVDRAMPPPVPQLLAAP